MFESHAFRPGIRSELEAGVRRQNASLGLGGPEDTLKIDLHCHDSHSDVPDETMGRILRVRETWLPPAKLLRTLKDNGADVLTVTNHNNARSCWEALDRGEDILPGAEFSCTLPDFNVGVHVLTFGFTPAQEEKLQRLRKDIYRFLEYTAAEDIPTVLAHPLQFHSPAGLPPLELMDRFAVLFERFEGVNGQRDAWQNLLTLTWIEGLNAEGIAAAAKRTGIRPEAFCRNPLSKRITGGSDCHMGIFAGSTGTRVSAPGWRRNPGSRAALALEGLRNGKIAPYGSHCEEEKLTVAFLDYFCQVALHMEDPGLLRLLLHRGTGGEKLAALAIANGMFELRRHKYTTRFLSLFHDCLQGRKPGLLVSLMTHQAYKPLLRDMEAIAQARVESPERLVQVLGEAIPGMFGRLTSLLADRVMAKVGEMEERGKSRLKTPDIIARIELPTHFRALFGPQPKKPAGRDLDPTGFDLGKWSDGLPFPLLASVVLGGAAFAASKVLYGKRPFLNGFAARLGKFRHPRRALWLTDTLADRNGVSHALQATLAEVRRRNLPIDFLACGQGPELEALLPGGHLVLLPPVAEFTLPFYQEQRIRLPGLLELQKTFLEGGYDRIVCSTEAPMGLLALYLKQAFNVPAFFYTHTDWLDFSRRTLGYDTQKVDRVRRILRAFYRRFDGVFLLNTEQKEYFASPAMGLNESRLFLTAHWADARFRPGPGARDRLFPDFPARAPVLLYAGRLSEEKGVMDLPEIFRAVQKRVPGARLAIAGTGPCLDRLRQALPGAAFLGWLDPEGLAKAYGSADLLLLPSWFDTFSCSLLEALSCGLPAVAFDTKGPRDILAGARGGLLATSPLDMADKAAMLLEDPRRLRALKSMALGRAAEYQAGSILSGLMSHLGLGGNLPGRPGNPASGPVKPAADSPTAAEDSQAFIGELLALMGA